MASYRLEWPSSGTESAPDRWSIETGAEAAQRVVRRMLFRRRQRAPWVRVVLLGPQGDVRDAFVTALTIDSWTDGALLPDVVSSSPVAAPEIERLQTRALNGLELVLGWAKARGVLTRSAADQVRLVFDAAMLGVTVESLK